MRLYLSIIMAVLCLLLLDASIAAQETAQIQENSTVNAIFEALSPEERVGQLFMVSLKGNDTSTSSDIARLIREYRIGGVYVSAEYGNFINSDSAPAQMLALTNRLQNLAQISPNLLLPIETTPIGSLITPTFVSPLPTPSEPSSPIAEVYNPIPLLIATQHEGDGYPFTQIRNGLTEIPNQMTLGATWNPFFAEEVGQVVGAELSLLGINMLLGPSLDVLDTPRPTLSGSLGTRTFGGNPFWVARMGEAYIRGVHAGSNGKLLTIAKNFPGFGSSDRELNRGVPTILKSLDDLRNTELIPFFRVTNPNKGDSSGMTDGLMTAHVRYQGLRGNVPMSLDPANLSVLLASQEIASWRENGGLIVSAPLGSSASLEYVVTNRTAFPARRLVQDALFAGNDLLYLTDFAFPDKPEDEIRNIEDAIDFAREQYRQNANFQAAVNRAVRRVIKAKVKIYGANLLTTRAEQPVDNLTLLANNSLNLDQIASESVTLVKPPTQLEGNPLTASPQPNESILIVTDARVAKDCDACPLFSLTGRTDLQEIIIRLFGTEASGQVTPQQIISITFANLKSFLDDDPNSAPFAEVIDDADWMVFVMHDIDVENHSQSDAVRLLLRNRYELVRNKKLVLFAFNAPYFLDETEISQLTAYYTFYSKGESQLELAARLLFQQLQPQGASPVTIPAFGPLDLSPNPLQTISLEAVQFIDTDGNTTLLEENASVELRVGEGILFRTGVIRDHNNNPVPDGTVVNFFRNYPLEGLPLEPIVAETVNGIAETLILKERDTPLRITASSNLAVRSMSFDIGPGILDTPTPIPTDTPLPTNTPSPTGTPTVETVVTATPTDIIIPAVTPVGSNEPLANGNRPVNGLGLLYTLIGAVLVGSAGFALGNDRFSLEERVRPALVAIAFALVTYTLYAGMAVAGLSWAIVEQGAENVWVAPLISVLSAILCMVVWFFKPGRMKRP